MTILLVLTALFVYYLTGFFIVISINNLWGVGLLAINSINISLIAIHLYEQDRSKRS